MLQVGSTPLIVNKTEFNSDTSPDQKHIKYTLDLMKNHQERLLHVCVTTTVPRDQCDRLEKCMEWLQGLGLGQADNLT